MRIAIPLASGVLAMHFGHCDRFAFLDTDPGNRKILKKDVLVPPEHQPGVLPVWLAEHGVGLVIAGGMGSRAQSLFAERGITVVVGAPAWTPEDLVLAYLAGTLETGTNVCDH